MEASSVAAWLLLATVVVRSSSISMEEMEPVTLVWYQSTSSAVSLYGNLQNYIMPQGQKYENKHNTTFTQNNDLYVGDEELLLEPLLARHGKLPSLMSLTKQWMENNEGEYNIITEDFPQDLNQQYDIKVHVLTNYGASNISHIHWSVQQKLTMLEERLPAHESVQHKVPAEVDKSGHTTLHSTQTSIECPLVTNDKTSSSFGHQDYIQMMRSLGMSQATYCKIRLDTKPPSRQTDNPATSGVMGLGSKFLIAMVPVSTVLAMGFSMLQFNSNMYDRFDNSTHKKNVSNRKDKPRFIIIEIDRNVESESVSPANNSASSGSQQLPTE